MGRNQVKWTEENIEYLTRAYSEASWAEIMDVLGRSKSSIQATARRLRLKRANAHANAWTKYEEEYVTKNQDKSLEELGAKIGRTPRAVKEKLETIRRWGTAKKKEHNDNLVKLSDYEIRINQTCYVELKRMIIIEGRFVADYGRHVLFQQENGIKESFQRADIATGKIKIQYQGGNENE